MSAISLRLPPSLHKQVRELAQHDQISMNHFITTAVAEKMAALLTVAYLEQRGERGSRRKFSAVLRKVRKRKPRPGDEL